jgi:hypothetical protein
LGLSTEGAQLCPSAGFETIAPVRALRPGVGIGALTLAGSLLGCGGGGPSGLPPPGIMPAPESCATVAPCGGDLTGTWKVLGGCLTPAELDTGGCTQIQLLTLSFRGTVTFNPDMTFTTTDFTEDRAEIDTTPVSCWAGYQDMNRTCAEEDQILKANVSHGVLLTYANCTGSTTCACTIAATGQTVFGDSGTYSLQGSLINFTSASGADSYEGLSYCVQDGLLHLTVAATSVDSTGAQTTTVYSDIVAQKQ